MKADKLRKNIVLFPIFYVLSTIYRFITDIRNWLYDKHIFTSVSFNIPVVSIGNITTGGTGKTPFTIFLVQKLSSNYSKIAVVSRGYGRKSKGLVVVSDGNGNIVSADMGGEEPVLIARKCRNAVVIASENRRNGIRYAIDIFNADIVFLDDAFQHRKVIRSCDIVLISSEQDVTNKMVLPLGDLRENISNLKRANFIVETKIPKREPVTDISSILSDIQCPVFQSTSHIKKVNDRQLNTVSSIEELRNIPVIAFSGIANPESFKNSLIKSGIIVKDYLVFRDHQKYSVEDFEHIKRVAAKNDCRIILTTEKDIVKIGNRYFEDIELYAIELEIELFEEDLFVKKLKSCIDSAY